jgi:hypothetical protein
MVTRKITMRIDAALAVRLHQAAIARGVEIGQVAGPAIERALNGSRWVDMTGERPAKAAVEAEVAAEPADETEPAALRVSA